VLYLKFQQGLSYKEIGKVTGHSVSNVGFLIHTGMKTLRGKVASDDRVAKQKDGTR
jgi:RNA polymerase sigma-70 factor (ECF subfamily)